jgi:Cof subfamily protein (haloacid dehalogenase superfamily)
MKFNKKYINKMVIQLKQEFGNVAEITTSGGGYYIEITAKGVSKGAAIKYLTNHLDISLKNSAAIGDSMNDYSGFEVVGYHIAMKNAVPALKEISKYETASVDDDGVAKAITSLFKI